MISSIIKRIIEEKTEAGLLREGVSLSGSKSRIPIISNSLYKYGIRCGIKYNAFQNKVLVNRINFQMQVCIDQKVLNENPSLAPLYEPLFRLFNKKFNISSVPDEIKLSITNFEYPEAMEQTDDTIHQRLTSVIDQCLEICEQKVTECSDALEAVSQVNIGIVKWNEQKNHWFY